jgi:hypothetical protein
MQESCVLQLLPPKQVETKEGAAGAEQSLETLTESGVSDYGVTDLVNLCPKHCPAAYKQEISAAVAATGKDDDPLSLAGKLVRWKTVVLAAESVSSKGRKRPRSSGVTTVTKEGRVTWYNPVLQRYCTVVGLLPTGSSSGSSSTVSSDSLTPTSTAAAAAAAAGGAAAGAAAAAGAGSVDKSSVAATSMEDVEVFWLDLQQLAEATIVLPTAKPKHRYVFYTSYYQLQLRVYYGCYSTHTTSSVQGVSCVACESDNAKCIQ